MKKTLLLSVLSLIVATTFLSSCSKYDEGSKFTLLSKKSRMVNDWHLTSISQDGVALNMSGITQYLDLRKDGSATLTISINIGGLLVDNSTDYTWEFNDDKSKLVLTETGATVTDDYTILKLTNSELKVQQIDPSNGDITIQTWETM
jgi:hypothetical protein